MIHCAGAGYGIGYELYYAQLPWLSVAEYGQSHMAPIRPP